MADINWEQFQTYISKDQNHVFLSASEKLIQDERVGNIKVLGLVNSLSIIRPMLILGSISRRKYSIKEHRHGCTAF